MRIQHVKQTNKQTYQHSDNRPNDRNLGFFISLNNTATTARMIELLDYSEASTCSNCKIELLDTCDGQNRYNKKNQQQKEPTNKQKNKRTNSPSCSHDDGPNDQSLGFFNRKKLQHIVMIRTTG